MDRKCVLSLLLKSIKPAKYWLRVTKKGSRAINIAVPIFNQILVINCQFRNGAGCLLVVCLCEALQDVNCGFNSQFCHLTSCTVSVLCVQKKVHKVLSLKLHPFFLQIPHLMYMWLVFTVLCVSRLYKWDRTSPGTDWAHAVQHWLVNMT